MRLTLFIFHKLIYTTVVSVFLLASTEGWGQTFNNLVVDSNPGAQSETSIAVAPSGSDTLMATWNDFSNDTYSQPGYSFSTDSGVTWSSPAILTQGLNSTDYEGGFDPSCSISQSGYEYYTFVNKYTNLPSTYPSGYDLGAVVMEYSKNNGQSWSGPYPVSGSPYEDKPYMTVDNSPSSSYRGNVYIAYTDWSNSTVQYLQNNLNIASSSTHGGSWQTRAVYSTSLVNTAVMGGIPAVGPHGGVYVAYYIGSQSTGGSGSIDIVKSTNGGASFSSPVTAVNNFIDLYEDNFGNLRVSSFPTLVVDPVSGYVYLAWTQEDGSNLNIHFVRSSSPDEITSWGTPFIATQATTGTRFMPWLTVNSSGLISLIYYKYDSGQVDVYVRQSYDGGQSFSGPDIKLTSVSSNPNVGTTFYSDYIGVASDPSGETHALWTDFRSGTSADIYSANFNQMPTVTMTTPYYYESGGSGAYYLINGNQSNQIQVQLGTSFTLKAVAPNNWAFAGWSYGDYHNPSTYYPGDNVSLYANIKEIQHSMDASAFSNNSQRKFVRIPTGVEFETYTDGGHVWLESSTDNGQNWELDYGGNPLDYNTNAAGGSPGSKCPSIDYLYNSSSGDDYVIVVFEEPTSNGYYTIDYLNLWYDSVTGNYDYYYPRTLYTETADPYSTNANPNVMIGTGGAVITFERKSSSGGSPGINWIGADIDGDGNITVSSPVQQISGTTSSSLNATVYCNDKTGSVSNFDPAIAWQQNTGTNSNDIMLSFVNFNYNGSTWTFSQSTPQDVSANLGNGDDYDPSITQMSDNSVRLAWITDQGGQPQPQFINVAYWNSNNPSTYGTFDNGPTSVSMNSTTDGNGVFAWSVSNYNRASDGSYTITLSTTGSAVQICNADTKSDMYVSSYYTSSSPYYFVTSGNMGNLQKTMLAQTPHDVELGVNPTQVTYGRGLTLSKGALKFRYSIGDLTVDGNSIEFVSLPDSVKHWTLDSLNTVLESQPFQVTSNSKFLFDENSGFLDSAAAIAAFGDTGYVRCVAQLVDNSTGAVIGTIGGDNYSSTSSHPYTLIPYLLNTSGVGTKMARLRIAVATNIDSPQVALVNIYQYVSSLDSTTINTLSLRTVGLIKDYSLAQNYPNPFNPTTTISYTVPKDGMVTLKVYDVLGRVVETLVNQDETIGRYTATFNGSNLASGVYFYRLDAAGHVLVKKMLMVK